MRRFFLVMMGILLAVSLLGCTEKKIEESPKNDVFTDDYFAGLKEMSLMGIAGPISGEKMQEVVDILQGATLSALEEGVSAEIKESFLLIITFEDGVSKTVIVSDSVVAKNEVESTRYLVADGTAFINGILEAFGVPVQAG